MRVERRLMSSCAAREMEIRLRRSVKQVTKTNFGASTDEISRHVSASDFVAVSLRRTGDSSSTWHRPLLFDSAAAAYSKAKSAAERFQLFQFALCPFSLSPRSSTFLAHPYNFLLFPRDELKLGLPSYSFSCHSSHLTSMADEGFDFNACVYDGISYVSRAQEPSAGVGKENIRLGRREGLSDPALNVADSVFVERIKSRITNWREGCRKSKENKGNKIGESFITSLGSILLAGKVHGDRPCTEIDVCSERQVQLTLRLLEQFSDDLVPLLIPAKSGGTQAVRVVYAPEKEDRELLEAETLIEEEKEIKQVRGFRGVIDLISASQKPIVSFNSLADFTFIYSKFIGPLPPTVDEFASALREVFPNVVDVSHMMKVFGPLNKVTNSNVAISYLDNHFSAPVDVRTPQLETENDHGSDVVTTSHLFAKLCLLMKIGHETTSKDKELLDWALKKYTNVFKALSDSPRGPSDKNISVLTKDVRKVSTGKLVFLWGFTSGSTSEELKSSLSKSHRVFHEKFDVCLVDKNCALVVFWNSGSAGAFLNVMNDRREIAGSLKEMVSEGLRAASYEAYERACSLAILEKNLGEALDSALEVKDQSSEAGSEEIFWCSESMMNSAELVL